MTVRTNLTLRQMIITHKKYVGDFGGRRRDSPGGTGAVPPPARGTKKPFTGWFFSRHRRAVPFSSLLLLCSTKKETANAIPLFVAEKEGSRPAALGQCRRPARGTKKPFTGWFFSRHRRAVPFSSLLSFFLRARKRDRKCDLFFVAEKEGFEPSRQLSQTYSLSRGAPSASWVLLHIACMM